MQNDYLFVCTANYLRSPTAEHVARMAGYAADSAGIDPGCAVRPLTGDAIDRADKIVCMDWQHAARVHELRPGRTADVQVWNIPDDYNYCADELVAILRSKLPPKQPRHTR